jgi:hypothetical protein
MALPGFPYNLLPVSCANIGLSQVLARKSGLKVPLLPLGPSCPLQTILLSDLLGFDSPLQLVLDLWTAFLQLEVHQTAIKVSSGLPHLTQQVQFKKMYAKRPLLSAGCHTRFDR